MSTLTGYVDSRQPQNSLSMAHLPKLAQQQGSADDDAGKKKKTAKRRKVNHACLYCRRSHMTCDEGRPCQRWWVTSTMNHNQAVDFWILSIKRDIGHLCHDEQKPKVQDKPLEPTAAVPASSYTPGIFCFHTLVYILWCWSSDSISDSGVGTTANSLMGHVHSPIYVSARDVWKRIFDSDVCPLYLLRIFSII